MESYESLVASGLTPIKPTPIVNGRVPPPYAPSMGRALVGTIPPEMQLDADFAENQYGGQVPSYRLMPPASSGKAAVNAAAQSTQIVVQQSSVGAGLLLETLGAKNPNQSVLNLQGTAVAGVDAAGNVTINSGGGDGLIHGETPWESDPSYVSLRDDFLRGGTSSGTFGELRWALNPAPATPTYVTGAAPNLGGLVFTNNATANNIFGLFMEAEATTLFSQMAWDLLNTPGWKCVWVFKLDAPFTNAPSGPAFSLAKTSFYIGLGYSQSNVTKGRPDIFVGLRFDTDTTAPAISDTTMKFEVVVNPLISAATRSNIQGTVIDTGITPTQGAFYRLEIQSVVAGVVTMSINGSTLVSFTAPSASLVVSASGAVAAGLGFAEVSAASFTGGWAAMPWASGSLMKVSGLVAGDAVLNGTQVVRNINGLVSIFASSATIGNHNTTFTLSGVPSLMPWMTFGNDTTATPVASSKSLYLDFFSFVWNPGVGGGTATPDPTKARYF